MATFGSGKYKYELVATWAKLPRHWNLGPVCDAAVNSKDEVHVFSRGAHPLTVWDKNGNFITSWGEGTFSANPHGIFIAPDDSIWLVDRDYHIVTHYTPDGKALQTLGKKLAPAPSFRGDPFNMPSGLALAPNGEMFVSDGYGGHRVHKFSPDGKLLLSWGKEGTGPGEFSLLHNVWVDKNSRVFIADRENSRIQIFDTNGKFLAQWTDLARPADLSIVNDVVFVGELGRDRVEGGLSLWTLDGTLITRWRSGEQGTKFVAPHGIGVDSQGSIYTCAASGGGALQKFQRV
ncbi:MAG: 6-bladed beta-propeller [Chloroflexi bacterium]|nr:6-bladed beta-propeller [Chloroflexota bacterium]